MALNPRLIKMVAEAKSKYGEPCDQQIHDGKIDLEHVRYQLAVIALSHAPEDVVRGLLQALLWPQYAFDSDEDCL